ncbi:DUF3095 domain-containing protein [Rhodobacteraceae bacterium F11138]|nr:DUF3095 domain-containing protein [Rhodobacteraceae bacterium F11138]
MVGQNDSIGFYDALPRITAFGALSDPDTYVPLPDGWVIGTADIVGSTGHIAAGRYKTVNMIGAAVISAQINANGDQGFPYVFGGDGASFAVDPDRASRSGQVLGQVKRWAADEFGIELRAAQVPVRDIRAAGHELSLARYQAASGVDYAMFSGGGLSWSERRMKQGAYGVEAAAPGVVPDLTGLSCRWSNVRASNGTILSVVVEPAPDASPVAFARTARQIVAVADQLQRRGHPVPPRGAGLRWPPPGLALEAHASRGRRSLALRKLRLLRETLFAFFFFKTGIRAGEFDPVHYAATVSDNADYRKFDDGLKMTLDCDADTHRQIQQILVQARSEGILQFGLFAQDEAMITCFVPSITRDDHIHLIDGASGGYTRAAAQIKAAV